MWRDGIKDGEKGIDTEQADNNACNVVDGQHVSRTESPTEEADERGQQEPPEQRSAEESGYDDCARQYRGYIGAFARSADAQHGEEGENIWDYDYEIGYGKAEHRGKILPRRSFARAIATNLRNGVLEKDIYADDSYGDTACHAQNQIVLLYLRLQHRIEKECDDCHDGIGTRHSCTRHHSRTAALAQCTLNAQHRYRSYGYGRS